MARWVFPREDERLSGKSWQKIFNHPAPIYRTPKSVAQHGEKSAYGGEQEHRGNRELDGVRYVANA